ncbi:MAG: dihydrolipoyl dehydrogenase [Solirubrobacteraceae bacterium]
MVVGELAESAELLVLGGGPGGYVAAIRAAQLGRQVTLIERAGAAGLGGVCLQVGCVPSKALIELAEAAARTREAEGMGLSAERVEVSLSRFQAWREELCRGLTRGVGQLLQVAGVKVVHGEARFNRPDRVAVRTPEDKAVFFEFEQAIIATGSRDRGLPGLPVDGGRVLDSTAALALSEVPATVVVVGAGYIGLELATALRKLGTAVTLVEAEARILPWLDASLTAPVMHRLRRLGIEVRLARTAERLDGEHLLMLTPDGAEDRIPAPLVLVTAGREPNTDQLGLAAVGLELGSGGLLPVGGDMRVEGDERIAAIGDVVAGPARAHKASAQALVAAEALSGKPSGYEPAVVPIVIFSDPEIATVGLGEGEAHELGMDVRVATFPLAASGRAAILGARDGFTRLVMDAASDRIVGVHVVGPRATELAAGGALAIEMMASAADLAGVMHPHPTLSEGLHEAAEMLLGQPIHVSAPAGSKLDDTNLSSPLVGRKL